MGVNLNILPWHTSKPIFAVGQEIAPLVGGKYVFSNQLLEFSPPEIFTENALYIISQISFNCDVSVLDYQAAIVKNPTLMLHQSADGNTPLLRKQLVLPTYLEQQEFVHPFYPRHSPNHLNFSLRGEIAQTAALVGKTALKASIMVTYYEVVDDKFIQEFKRNGGLK